MKDPLAGMSDITVGVNRLRFILYIVLDPRDERCNRKDENTLGERKSHPT